MLFSGKKITLFLALFLFLGGLSYAGFFFYKIHETGKKISVREKKPTLLETFKSIAEGQKNPLKGENRGRINILLLGIAGEGKPGKNLTDTIMMASIDTEKKRLALISLPRDTLVTIPEIRTQTKINSVYQIGLSREKNVDEAVSLIKNVFLETTSLETDYYMILNFDGFEKAVDAIGGINVMNERDIYDTRYPGPNYSYETFELKKGLHLLDGKTALKYARQRKGDPEGDFGRAKRQQQIMQAVKNKVFGTGKLLNAFAMSDFLDALGENIKTDIETGDMERFLSMAKNIDTQNITTVVIDAWKKESLLKVSHVYWNDQRAFVLVPRSGNWSEVRELAENVFDLDRIERRKENIQKEEASIVVINKSGDPKISSRIKKLLEESFGYKKVSLYVDRDKDVWEKTQVYDLSEGKKPFTLDELISSLPATLSGDSPKLLQKTLSEKKEMDFLAVIGKDLIDRYNMEEASFEDYRKFQEDETFGEKQEEIIEIRKE